jgi:hypothetical protein
MQDGFYLAQFANGRDAGHGVVVKRGETVVGGDSSHWYEGTITDTRDGSVSGHITVRQHTPGNPSVFGFFDEFPLNVAGRQNGDAWQLVGTTPVAPGRPMQLNLRMLRAD